MTSSSDDARDLLAHDSAETLAAISSPASRSGEDVRRRGWYWHWNATVTQYAPLLGLQGIGLLNSYTVWTDRREHSPHRGYAFPTQQTESDFYGIERAELIVINKILVALDLIEIRKEMVQRTDDRGRRWKVPHNFYRVKDKGDNFVLTLDDVMRVVALAERDKPVYRHIRHIFSTRFAPIDQSNVWHSILIAARQNLTWQELARRTAAEEDRASARTRAGHSARKENLRLSGNRDSAAPPVPVNDSINDGMTVGVDTSVATANKGLPVDVPPANVGSASNSEPSIAPGNKDDSTSVEPNNSTYHQQETSTTTTPDFENSHDNEAYGQSGSGPGSAAAPVDVGGEATVLRRFAAANGRDPSLAERELLSELAARFDATARAGVTRRGSGWEWVAAAITEAVDSGSAYVAPKRIREILQRWQREGYRSDRKKNRGILGNVGDDTLVLGDVEEFDTPFGMSNRECWHETSRTLAMILDRTVLADLLRGTAIVGCSLTEIEVLAPTIRQADLLGGEYRSLVNGKLSEVVQAQVRLTLLAPVETHSDILPAIEPEPASVQSPLHRHDFFIPECGFSSRNLWSAMTSELSRAPGRSNQELLGWLRSADLRGRIEDELVIVAANETVRRRIGERHHFELEASIRNVTGKQWSVTVMTEEQWLASQTAAIETASHPQDQAAS